MDMQSPRELCKLIARCWIGTSLLLLSCGKTSFNSNAQQNGADANRGGTDANANKGTLPYGTPPSTDINQAGWSNDIVKSLVDGLLKNASTTGADGQPVAGGADASTAYSGCRVETTPPMLEHSRPIFMPVKARKFASPVNFAPLPELLVTSRSYLSSITRDLWKARLTKGQMTKLQMVAVVA